MGNTAAYRMCTRCIMDTTDADITFGDDGVCSHCSRFDREVQPKMLSGESARGVFDETIARIKRDGENAEYDCIVGLSGGLDSSYLAFLAVKHGLRPLAVHFDNGWNSELAIKNIEVIVRSLGLDLETHVIDWEEFRDIQRSLFKASVLDIELVTDHAFVAALYEVARKRRIKYILNGFNIIGESILPKSWSHFKMDCRNLRAIQKRYGRLKIRKLPTMAVLKYAFYRFVARFESVYLLNCADYNRAEAARVLEQEIGYRPYGNKHCESLFTLYYQTYVLPRKFGIDKRKAHYSSLVLSGQMTREEALAELEREPYPSAEADAKTSYVAKKLGFSDEEFEAILSAPPRPHSDFPSDEPLYKALHRVLTVLRRLAGRGADAAGNS